MRAHLRIVPLMALGAACKLDLPVPDQPRTVRAGEAGVEVSADARTLRLLGPDGTERLVLPADAFVLGLVPALKPTASYDPWWLVADDPLRPPPPDGLRWAAPTAAAVDSLADDEAVLRLTYEDAEARLTLRARADGRWRAHLEIVSSEEPAAWLRLRLRASATEGFYGLGEWGDAVDHRGKLRPMQMEADLSTESASNDNHVPVPLLVGTRGWGVFVESRRAGLFDVATADADLVEITYANVHAGTDGAPRADPDGLVFHLLAPPHALDATRLYYDITGYPLLPAPWAYGPWIWRDENRDQAEVLDDIEKIRSLDLATSGLWIDRPYATAVNTFDFDAAKFPDPPAMIRAAHDAGLRLALWHTPYLEEAAEPLAAEARAKGYFVPSPGPSLNHWSVPIDFTNPDAYAWWQGLVRRYTDLGIEGFKLDYAEDVVVGIAGARTAWRFADGSDERTMHHDYTLLYHRLYAQTLPETGGFLLCRAGRWGDQRNVSVVWPGDLDAGFQQVGDLVDGKGAVGGLPASVAMGLSLGVSGFPFYGADTGGYRHSPPGREVYVRWFQQTALSGVMQVGDSSSQPPWVFTAQNGRDEAVLALYREYARLHLRLFPYAWTYAKRIAQDGRPLQRPVGLAHPELGVHPPDVYLFGEHLLVAPVVEAGATVRRAPLPAGTWYDWWDGTRYEGGTERELPAPLEKLPLLVRAGGLVPMLRPTIDTLAPVARPQEIESFAADAGRLHVRVAPGPASEFVLYDGARVAQAPAAGGLDLEAADGSEFVSGMTLVVGPIAKPAQILAGESALAERTDAAALDRADDGWLWQAAAGGTLQVKLRPGRHKVSVR